MNDLQVMLSIWDRTGTLVRKEENDNGTKVFLPNNVEVTFDKDSNYIDITFVKEWKDAK